MWNQIVGDRPLGTFVSYDGHDQQQRANDDSLPQADRCAFSEGERDQA
jgi:hypothetical protein